MAEQLGVELVSPEGVTYSGTAEMVVARTAEGGDIAFCAGHVPFLGVLAVWTVEVVRPGAERDVFAVHRGFVQVSSNKVSILSDVSETAGEINAARAEKARARAERRLAEDSSDKTAADALERAKLRLLVAAGAGTDQ